MPAFPGIAGRSSSDRPIMKDACDPPITEALHACASGILAAEAAVGLLSGCGSWLHRDGFTSQFITTAGDADNGAILMAAIDWQAAVTALDHGLLPCSSGERHVLKLAAEHRRRNPGQPQRRPDRHRPAQRHPRGRGRRSRVRSILLMPPARRPQGKGEGRDP